MIYKIRKLQNKDAEICFNNISQEIIFNKIKKYNGWSIENIRESILNKKFICIGFCHNKKLIGFLLSSPSYNEKSCEIEIMLICVNKNYRRKGIGGYLIKNLIKKLNKLEKIKIYVEFLKTNNTAKLFYNNYGFEKVYERKKYYILKNNKKEDAEVQSLLIEN